MAEFFDTAHGEFVWDDDREAWSGDAPSEGWEAVSPELAYLRETIVEAMAGLEDPK